MAERPSRRRKKKDEVQAERTAEETEIGKHLRFNLATKSSNFMGHKVEYFTGSKAVDMMLDSKWASGKGSADILFTDRSSVVHYLDRLLQKGMFHRALKVVKRSKKDEKKEKDAKKEEKKESKKEEAKSKKDSKDKLEKDVTEKEEGTPKSKKTKEGKKKIKLEPTEDQVFKDGNDAYVWIYDPIKPMYYVYGLLLVVGAIAVCLFPLWPPWMRAGTYYVSLAGAGVVASILALAVVRFILFALVWAGSMGRVHLWIFPNLLADVGILESFQPAYEYTDNKPDASTTKGKLADDQEEEEKTKSNEEIKEEKTEAIEGENADGDEQNLNDGEDCDNADDCSDGGDGDGGDGGEEDGEEDGSRSSSNPDHREEFEFINPEDVSAAGL